MLTNDHTHNIVSVIVIKREGERDIYRERDMNKKKLYEYI